MFCCNLCREENDSVQDPLEIFPDAESDINCGSERKPSKAQLAWISDDVE